VAVYALIALAFLVVYKASRMINFARPHVLLLGVLFVRPYGFFGHSDARRI
jgi:branched-subunit amino acid ABC-type transport system permease component